MKKLKLINCCRTMLLIISISLFSATLYAQTISVKGKVVDEQGEAVIGATVKLKSHAGATTTDINGNFAIQVPANENTLVVSYIGYKTQEILVTNATNNLRITLTVNASSLNEVVVVGYGTQRKRDITGAIGSITEDQLQAVPSDNVIDQLKGRMAGVDIVTNSTQPGASDQIRIRGSRSLGSSQSQDDSQNQPLLVVDGVPFIGGSINDLNPDDIASLDVLKDASATAIYGSRASNGVIIITTKKGKADDKLTVNFSSLNSLSKITKEVNVLSASQFRAAVLSPQAGLTQAQQGEVGGASTDWQNQIYRQGFASD